MKLARAHVAATLLGLVLLSACSGDGDGGTVSDPAGSGGGAGSGSSSGASAGEMPTSVPPPDGEVVGVGTVMDMGQGDPELCLGAIAESYPPQCSGIPITNWDWAPVKDTSESSGTTRWGSYAVTGTYDGETFTVTQGADELGPLRPRSARREPVRDPLPRARGWVGRRRRRQGVLRGPGRGLHRGGPAADVRRLVHRPDLGRGLGRRRQRQHRQRPGHRRPRGRRGRAAQGLGRPAVRHGLRASPRPSSSRSRTASRACPACSAAARSSTSSWSTSSGTTARSRPGPTRRTARASW